MFKFAINTLSNLIDVGVKDGIIKGSPKGGTKKVTIECAVSWQIVSHSSFVSINKLRGFRDTIVEFAFTENPSILEDRTGELVIRNAFGIGKTISILQPGGVFTYGYYIEPVTDYSSGVYFNADGSELNLGFKAYKETFLNGESTGEIVEIKDINFNTSAFVTKTQDYWDEGVNYLSFITNNNTSEEIQSLGEITIIPVVDSEGDIEFINNYTFNLYQSAGTKVYENLQITDFYYDVRDAAGGTLTPVINTSVDYKWNGIGETTTLTYGYLDLNADNIEAAIVGGVTDFVTINTDTAIVSWTENTNTSEGRTATVSLTVSMYSLSTSKQAIAEQLKDTISYYSPIEITSFTVNSTIPASGGSVSSGTVNYVQVVNYVSGNTSNITSGATVTYGNAVSANSLGTDLKDRSSVGTLSVTVSLNETSDTASATVYQDANTRYLNGIYIVPYQPDSSWIVTVSNGNWNTCPASGGYVKCYGYCVYKYSSGGEKDELYTSDAALSWSGSPGWITNHENGGYHISSRGTSVESARSSTATWSYSGFTSPGKTLTQEANAVINSSYSTSTTWNTPNISIGSGIGPAGGSATVSHSQSGTTTYYYLYTSGSTSGPYYSYPSGSTSIAITSNGNSRFSLSGNTLSHSSMGTYEGTDTCTVTVTGSGGKTNSASVSATNTYSDSGGSVSYGNVSAGAITNATIPASGGSATAYAGNGSQSWSKTAVTRSYASGSSKTITAASSGTNAVAPSASSYTASANSKGSTESSTTTVGSQYVTWSANGKSTGGTMYVYQAKNEITGTTYGNWSYNWTTSGNSTRTRSVTYNYTSGSSSSGNPQTETGGTRYLVLSQEGGSSNPAYNFAASGGSGTLSIHSHDYWDSDYVQQVSVSNTTCTCSGFSCSVSGSTLTISATSKGTSVSSANSATIVTSKSGFVTRSGYTYVTQAANTRTYGNVSVTSHGTAGDIPASGGSTKASGGSGTQTISYTSGSTEAGTVTCGTYSTVSASSRGTTEGSRVKVGTSTATLTGQGGKTATVSVDVYQSENKIISTSYSVNDPDSANISGSIDVVNGITLTMPLDTICTVFTSTYSSGSTGSQNLSGWDTSSSATVVASNTSTGASTTITGNISRSDSSTTTTVKISASKQTLMSIVVQYDFYTVSFTVYPKNGDTVISTAGKTFTHSFASGGSIRPV